MNSVGTGFAGIGSGGAWTHAVTAGADSILYVFVGGRTHSNDMDIDSISSDIDGAFTQLAKAANNTRLSGIYYLVNPTAGTHTITIATTGTDRYYAANSVQMFNIDPLTGTVVNAIGTGSTPAASILAADNDSVICLMTQLAIVTSATPEAGGIVLIAPLGTTAGSPTDENITISVAYQRGVAAGTIASTFTTDQTTAWAADAVLASKLPVVAYPVAVDMGLIAAVTEPRMVNGYDLAAAPQRIAQLENKLKDLESRVEHSKRGTWGR